MQELDTRSIDWTVYRVLGSINHANGKRMYTLELFAKHPSTSTAAYAGDAVPNVMLAACIRGHDDDHQ